MTTCARDDCAAPAGRNGVACHEHFTALVPPFLASALFRRQDEFTKAWLLRQVACAVRGEPWAT
jgi:hypothetical protein